MSSAHALSSSEYQKLGHIVKCTASTKRYSEQNQKNCDWITRAKMKGDDLTEYRAKMGKAVSEAILSDPQERARRAAQMSANNKTHEARLKSKNTAKVTSARPEILAQRTANLARWRETHFDEFYEKCLLAMHNSWVSKPELALLEVVKNHPDYNFTRNQCVKSKNFTAISKRKQVDIGDSDRRVYLEFDGILHFYSVRGDDIYISTQRKDRELDEHILLHQWTLIRVSYDLWKNEFSNECLKKLFQLLDDPQSGVFCLGAKYGDRNILSVQPTLESET